MSQPNESPLVEFRAVSEDYFHTANIPLLRGRFFSMQEGDDVQPVVVINEAMAKQIWPGEDPLGKRVGDETKATVIGSCWRRKELWSAAQTFSRDVCAVLTEELLAGCSGPPSQSSRSARRTITVTCFVAIVLTFRGW